MPYAQAAGMAMGAIGGYMGGKADKRQQVAMEKARRRAIKKMKETWRQAYAKSQGEFGQARQDIIGQGISGMGNLTAGMAGGGLLNTTAAANFGRGVMGDTQQSLGRLGAMRASSEYGKWMDLANIKGMTKFDNFAPQSQAEAWGTAGAELGGAWGDLYDEE